MARQRRSDSDGDTVVGSDRTAKAKEGITIQVGRGRSNKLLEVGGTRPRSVRFPDVVWRQIEARAKAKGMTLHAALHAAILAWLEAAA